MAFDKARPRALPPTLSIPQLANLLDCAPSTLYAQLKAGTFAWPIVMVGTDRRVPRDYVLLKLSGIDPDAVERLREEVSGVRAEVAALAGMFRSVFAVAAD